ncbi:hypothetical protein [Runella slithyformis]|uniref:Uncharacterized protein n=1 Tax=Runella slithyformis (strain ATCC 29530 / DSM 19594 / LMG 11500 / NCIMB 11436 / LSU 4) TaxID=761193 RepID=A0A7U4E7R8_RUNSL|nr:hypothetical protein [Runella slithyformis]AEI50664.1 hypothetical protein Runsl_4326 [Runella slithyformis DSM 19594]
MENHQNKDLLIQELENQVKMLQELVGNQCMIIGAKELLIFDYKRQIEDLEHREKQLFWSFQRCN